MEDPKNSPGQSVSEGKKREQDAPLRVMGRKVTTKRKAARKSPKERLNSIHKLFLLRPTIWNPFQKLAEEHLWQAATRAALSTISVAALHSLIAQRVLTFLTTYGVNLFPPQKRDRIHIGPPDGEMVVQRTKKPGRNQIGLAGPIYLYDGLKMKSKERKVFRDAHGGDSPTNDEEILNSKMGVAMQEYFSALIELTGSSWEGEQGGGHDGEEEDDIEEKCEECEEGDVIQARKSDLAGEWLEDLEGKDDAGEAGKDDLAPSSVSKDAAVLTEAQKLVAMILKG